MKAYASVLVLLAAASIAGVASGAVYKCKGPDGKIIYSGTPCVGEGEAIPRSRLGGNTVAPTVDSDSEPESARSGSSSAPRAQVTEPGKCYEDSDLRDIQVRLSSQTYSLAERQFLGDEQGRVLSCALARFTADERKTRSDALRQLGKGDKAGIAQRTILGLYDRYRTEAEQQVERRTRAVEEAARSKPFIVIDGKQYIPAKGGVIDPATGKFCPQSGNTFFCN